jgi:hypothetical protein
MEMVENHQTFLKISKRDRELQELTGTHSNSLEIVGTN